MQLSLGLDVSTPLPAVYDRLRLAFGAFRDGPRPAPFDQLVKGLIASGMHEEAALGAFQRLKARFYPWDGLAGATVETVEAVLGPMPHVEIKAAWLVEAARRIRAETGGTGLEALADQPVAAAAAWLRRFPGVGERCAAMVLNFSTLRRPAMVVEGHVWRVARRIGLAARGADPSMTAAAILEAAPANWTGEDLFDLHWLLKRLGQTLCGDVRTRCGACPVASLCEERRRSGSGRSANVLTLTRGRP